MSLDLEEVDLLCLYKSSSIDGEILKWLGQENHFLLLFNSGCPLPQDFKNVRSYEISYDNAPEVVKKVAWNHQFANIKWIATVEEPLFFEARKLLEEYSLGVNLYVSDYSDFGILALKNLFFNLANRKRVIPLKNIAGTFTGIPAIICGAGASLKKNSEVLKEVSEKALIFAGGTALSYLAKWKVKPHFAAAIDKEFSFDSPFDIPFFFKGRTNYRVFKKLSSPAIFVRGHETFLESYILDLLGFDKDSFDGGWNVATFLTEMAIFLGCDPIILVGVDLSFTGGRKYAGEKGEETKNLIEKRDVFGSEVKTQKDWFLASLWLKDLKEKFKDRHLINGSEGLPLEGFEVGDLALFSSFPSFDLSKLVEERLSLAADFEIPVERLFSVKGVLEKSFLNCFSYLNAYFEEKIKFSDLKAAFNNEPVYLFALFPLWEIFKWEILKSVSENFILGREINEALFYKRVVEEYLKFFEFVKF